MSDTLSEQPTAAPSSSRRFREVERGFELAWEGGPPQIEAFLASAGEEERPALA